MSFGRKKDEGVDAPQTDKPITGGNVPTAKTGTPDASTVDPKSDDAGKPPALTDAELRDAPQHVKDAAAKDGGVVRAAPKGGEGELGRAVDAAYPELQPPTPPAEYRAAPTAPGELPEREKWGQGDDRAIVNPKDVAEPGSVVEVRTRDPRSSGVYAGGEHITAAARQVQVDVVRGRSADHLSQLLTDPRVEVRVVNVVR